MDDTQIAAQPGIHPVIFGQLAIEAYKRYETSGSKDDIDEAVELAEESVLSGCKGDASLPERLTNLGVMLESRYRQTGEMADLEEAIGAAKQAVDMVPQDHSKRADFLSNFGNKLEGRYERTGEMADLEAAISLTRQAIESTTNDHSNRAAFLNNLGIKLCRRYERTEEIANLEEAIRAAQQAIDSTPVGHPDQTIWLNNLGNMLESRYGRTDEMANLEEAIVAVKKAVRSAPPNHPDRLIWLNNLGNKLERRYERTGSIADLQEAIVTSREAAESTPHNHVSRANRLNNLGNKLERLFKRSGDISDLEEAIRVARQTIRSIPHNHPDRAACLYNLGTKLESRYEQTGETADLREACSALQDSWDCQTAIPLRRVKAAVRLLKLLWDQGKIDTAIKLGHDIIDQIPAVNTRVLTRADRQFVVSTFAGVAADLCSFLLASNQPVDDALDCLERGRAVIIGQIVDDRSDLSSLAQYPDIAHRYERLRDEINTPLPQLNNSSVQSQVVNRRRKAVVELNACIREIRGIPGQERFLLGQTTAQMQDCAAGGTIVVLNVTKLRSDAILIFPAAIKTLPLPQLRASDAEAWLNKKWTGPRSERSQRNREYLQYLAWLWKVCASQVLDEIYCTHETLPEIPRIWWIGTGLASSMPFHAAGIHSPNSRENIISSAISSYTPSIKALGFAQHRATTTNNMKGSLLITTMPTTPGYASLPYVAEEKRKVIEAANGRIPVETMEFPSVEHVVNSVRCCRIAHFACHGSTDRVDPSKSGLILQKRRENNEAEEDRLTVNRMSELSLENACIAYLSACSTAENKAARLADEVIHVVSGFQMAGFPHVVGCLWASIDRVCMQIASEFYASLLWQSATRWDGRTVASALRQAVLMVRETEMDMPLIWAQFVHYGA